MPSLARLRLLPATATRQRRHKETPTDAPKRHHSDITKAPVEPYENSKALQSARDFYDNLLQQAAVVRESSLGALSLTEQRPSEATVREANAHALAAQEALRTVQRLARRLQELAEGASEDVKKLAQLARERADEALGAAQAAAKAAETVRDRAPAPPAGQSHDPRYTPPSDRRVVENDDGAKFDADGNKSNRQNGSFDDDAKTNRYVIAYWEIEPFTDTEMKAYRKHGAEKDKEVKMGDGPSTASGGESGSDGEEEEPDAYDSDVSSNPFDGKLGSDGEEGGEKEEEEEEEEDDGEEEEDDGDKTKKAKKAEEKKEKKARNAAGVVLRKKKENDTEAAAEAARKDKAAAAAERAKTAEAVAEKAREELLRLANMRYWQVLCWLDKLQKDSVVLEHLGLGLEEGDLPGIENKVRAACVQWAREGGGHEGRGKVNPKGSPVIWAILLFLQTLAERNEPPRVVVQEKEYVEERRKTKTKRTTEKDGTVVVSEESVDSSERYKASLFYTLKELHKYLKKFQGASCQDRAPQNTSATKVRGKNATTQAQQVDKYKVPKLRHDSLGLGKAANVKADFLHNLLRRAEVAAQAERARQAVLADARREAVNRALTEWTKNKDPRRVEESVAIQRAEERAEEQAAKPAAEAARKEAERAWETATGLCEPVRKLEPPEVAPLQKPKTQTLRNRDPDMTPVAVRRKPDPFTKDRESPAPDKASPKPGSSGGGGRGGGGVVELVMDDKAIKDAFTTFDRLDAEEEKRIERIEKQRSLKTWREDKQKQAEKEAVEKAKADEKYSIAKANATAKAKKAATTKAEQARSAAGAATRKATRLKKAADEKEKVAKRGKAFGSQKVREDAKAASAAAEAAAKEAAAKEAEAEAAEAELAALNGDDGTLS